MSCRKAIIYASKWWAASINFVWVTEVLQRWGKFGMVSLSGRIHKSELAFSCSPSYGFVVFILTGKFMNKSDLLLNNDNKFDHLIICFDLDVQHQQALLHHHIFLLFLISILMFGKYYKSFWWDLCLCKIVAHVWPFA